MFQFETHFRANQIHAGEPLFRIEKRMKRKLGQRGQGTVEYILLLALAVAIILGGIYQLNTAFRVWADNYFGNYLTCLLETGELPGLGNPEPGSCAAEFKPFSLADGETLPGGGGGPDGDSSTDNSTNTDDPANSKGGGGLSSANAEANGGYSASGSTFGRGGTRTRVRRGGTNAADEDGGASGGAAPSAWANIGYQSDKPVLTPVRYRGIAGRGRVIDDEKEDTRTKITSTVSGGVDPDKPAERIRVKPKIVSTDAELEKPEFSVGNFLRYLIIIAIIIAIVIFIGGQALQVSKST